MCNFGFRQGYGLLTEEMITYLTDEQIMLLEQLTYLTDDVADAAGVLLGPYDSVENLLQQFDDDALQRLEDPGNPDSTKDYTGGKKWAAIIRQIKSDPDLYSLDIVNKDETVVLLSHKSPDSVINVKVEFGEGDDKISLDAIAERAKKYQPKPKITYKIIQEYVEKKYGFKVHTAYIAEVKRALGLSMYYDTPNAAEELKQPRKYPPKEKAEAIMEALKHFEVI